MGEQYPIKAEESFGEPDHSGHPEVRGVGEMGSEEGVGTVMDVEDDVAGRDIGLQKLLRTNSENEWRLTA